MSDDKRPAQCRFRLRDEGKAYPKSGCLACGRTILTGLGNECGNGRAEVDLTAEPDMAPRPRPLEEISPSDVDRATMTLNLTKREMAVVEQLAASHELSKTAVIRQALRVYQMIQARIAAGETMTFSGDKERVALFVGPGFDALTVGPKQAERSE